MKSTREVVTVLSILTIVWLLVFVYSVWAQSQTQLIEEVAGEWLEVGPYPDRAEGCYWVLTNSSPAEAFLIDAIENHLNQSIHVPWELGHELIYLYEQRGGFVKYEGKYYSFGFSFADVFDVPKGIPIPVTTVGFIPLGVGWIGVGLNKWKSKHLGRAET